MYNGKAKKIKLKDKVMYRKTLPTYSIYAAFTLSEDEVAEVFFDRPIDISDANIDHINSLIRATFEVTDDQIDWRDDQTLWLW